LITINIGFHARNVWAVGKLVGMFFQNELNALQGFGDAVHFFFGRPPFLPLMRADWALRGVLMDPKSAAALMGL